MTVRTITQRLEQALLRDGPMRGELYAFELEGLVDDLKASMAQDQDEYIFAVTENNGDVAMVLVEQSGRVHSNEQARTKLQALWPAAYERNMQRLIPCNGYHRHPARLQLRSRSIMLPTDSRDGDHPVPRKR